MIKMTRKRPRYPNSQPESGPEKFILHLPSGKPPTLRDLILAMCAIIITLGVFFTGGKFAGQKPDLIDEVQIVETPRPPPPPKEILQPPKPTPPPPEHLTPPPKDQTPPPPQFGLEKDATSENGDLSVATGNTLAKKSDSLVKPAPPPPPPPEPARLDQEPEALDKVVPVYPPWAEEQGVTSKVLVLVTIDVEGKVTEAHIQKSGGKDFDKASLQAAQSTHYRPYVERGHPFPAKFIVTFAFIL